MAEFTILHVGLLVAVFLAGIVVGWIFRSGRSKREKISITAGWQAQIDSQQSEHDRLSGQNKSLMEQISQYQASNKDSKLRAQELAGLLKEALARRDELQRQLKEIRCNLEIAIVQRDNFKSDVDANAIRGAAATNSLKKKDDEIAKLTTSLTNWQKRVPPLVERYRQRDLETQQLEVELQRTNEHLATLENLTQNDSTRIEPVDPSSLPHGLDASNEAHTETSVLDLINLDDQIDIRSANGLESTEEPGVPGGDESTDDDLEEIKGIGPAIAKTLNELGICRFNQIAEISEYDIDRVAHRLKGFRSRIYREDWIGQARLLQHQKNNDSQPA